MTLLRHWWRTTTHPARSLLNDPSVMLDPTEFAIFGIRKQLEVIDMHREYFLPGKPMKGQATLVKFVDEVIEPHILDDSNDYESLLNSSLDWYFN